MWAQLRASFGCLIRGVQARSPHPAGFGSHQAAKVEGKGRGGERDPAPPWQPCTGSNMNASAAEWVGGSPHRRRQQSLRPSAAAEDPPASDHLVGEY